MMSHAAVPLAFEDALMPNEFTIEVADNLAQASLRDHVERVVRDYFDALDGEIPSDVYELILQEVELPLLSVVLEKTRGNQSKSAQILGLNRGTLRKKLKKYQLMA